MSNKVFSVIIETWTEYERGWGSRPDGATLHLDLADHKAFVDAFNREHNMSAVVPYEYSTADRRPKDIDVSEEIYNELLTLHDAGKFGRFLCRVEEAAIRSGNIAHGKFDIVLKNVSGQPFDPVGRNLPAKESKDRILALAAVGIDAFEVAVV